MAAKRLLVSLNEKINNSSSSKIAKDLIMASLELEEDEVFSKLADKRLKETKHWVNHVDAWK
ncbi:hypothetical protein [Rickettsia endosymbiont of Orchestes rusci]|uniref:hypothetical protein n=1 Tax=Rickettsia endosymbiont of Orchestes rusci TaxID=3066250 RepID=UPI00209E9A52|nr:hypothetical protein [Rickettsia endosymbiont of Ceutorhynchus assimilis]